MDLHSGQLRQVGSVAAVKPSFLTIHPNGRALYAVNELETYNGSATGAVSAFAVANDSGALTLRNQQGSGGGAPCYVSVDRSGSVALVANYLGGSVALLPIQPDGALAPATQVVRHTGAGPHKNQAAPHAHYIHADPSNRFALVADLGADRVFVYRIDLDAKSLRHPRVGRTPQLWPPCYRARRAPIELGVSHGAHRAGARPFAASRGSRATPFG